MKESARQQFRWAPHSGGITILKPRDFEQSGEVEAKNSYEAWSALRGAEGELQVGDVLESEAGELRICKYVGFEQARWLVPEPVQAVEQDAPAEQAEQPVG